MQQPGKYEFNRNNLSMFSRPCAKIKRLEAKTGMNNKTKLQALVVHIQVYLHSCSICSGISGGWWEWQSMDLHVGLDYFLFIEQLGK